MTDGKRARRALRPRGRRGGDDAEDLDDGLRLAFTLVPTDEMARIEAALARMPGPSAASTLRGLGDFAASLGAHALHSQLDDTDEAVVIEVDGEGVTLSRQELLAIADRAVMRGLGRLMRDAFDKVFAPGPGTTSAPQPEGPVVEVFTAEQWQERLAARRRRR
jgi:hypothetical protein